MTSHLDAGQADRAAGVMLAMACGDALGAPYEFGPPLPPDMVLEMSGGGSFGWEPGEWTDDTSMAVPLLQEGLVAVRDGGQLLDRLDRVALAWDAWSITAPDVGNQTRAVLRAAYHSSDGITAASLARAARNHHESTGRSGGNGSLMRTAPIALAYLHDRAGLARAAREVSSLTHVDPQAGDACVLWCDAVRHAVLDAELDVRVGLDLLDVSAAATWAKLIDDAETRAPHDFPHNGWVVHAFQGAWSAIATTSVGADCGRAAASTHLQRAIEAAVRGGNDTDTVAAIAGSLLGARWGASAVPAHWREVVHGWPALTGDELADLGLALAQASHGNDEPA